MYGYFLELHIIWRSRSLRQIIDLIDADKSQYFAITEFDIVLSFDHQVCFSRKNDRKKGKSVVSFTHEQILIPAKQAKQRWTTLRMSRPLFVGSNLGSNLPSCQ